MRDSFRRDGGRFVTFVTAIAAAVVAGCLTFASSPAKAQSNVDTEVYEDKGFYQSYVFGLPDNPSEAWLLAYGGRLYDSWWAVLFQDPPETPHPAYPKPGEALASDTWRCVECHGWDYKGKDGRFASGSHATGIKGINAMKGEDPARIAAVIRNKTHGFTPDLIPDTAVNALALFVNKGQAETESVVEPKTGKVRGNAERGRAVFQNVCAICHDYDGKAWITGDEDALTTLGAIAAENPWRGLHKVMNGQTYADMPALRAFGLQTVLDVLAYAQTLPRD